MDDWKWGYTHFEDKAWLPENSGESIQEVNIPYGAIPHLFPTVTVVIVAITIVVIPAGKLIGLMITRGTAAGVACVAGVFGPVVIKIRLGFVAVSYTHLDVYKRQV